MLELIYYLIMCIIYFMWWNKFKKIKNLSNHSRLCIGYSIPGHSIWKRMPWGLADMHSFSYTNDQILYNQFSPYFLCRVSWLPIITNLGCLSQIRLNEYQLKSITFNYNTTPGYRNGTESFFGLKGRPSVVRDV